MMGTNDHDSKYLILKGSTLSTEFLITNYIYAFIKSKETF